MKPPRDPLRALVCLALAIELIVLAIALAGCGADSAAASADNHGFGWQYDATSAHGLKLRKPGATARDADELERRAETVATCAGDVGAFAPPPFVVFVAPGEPNSARGHYWPSPSLIVIEDPGNAVLVAALFEHEALHYVLDRRGDLDAGHTSPLWASCSFAL